MLKSVFAAALLAASASSVQAGVLFSDDFDALPAALTVTSMPGWTVGGNVDVVATGTYGISCNGNCVDLDGTTGPGTLTSNSIAFAAGDVLTISFDLSGSQRSRANDVFQFTANFAAPTDFTDAACLSGFVSCGSGDFYGQTTLGLYQIDLAGGSPWTTYALSFTPTQSGSLQLYFGTTSADNIGPLIDNVLVTQSGAVPEPATWAMFIAGFGLIGAGLRRRRAAIA